jgi:hypothetical protein
VVAMPFNIQCFRLIIITYLQNKNKNLLKKKDESKNLNLKQMRTMKLKEKRKFQILKYFISTGFHLKVYFLVLIFHTIFFLTYSFIFSDLILSNKGCAFQFIGLGKTIFIKKRIPHHQLNN